MMTVNIQAQRLEPLYEIEQAGEYLHRSPWTIRRDIKAGRIRCLRLGRRILIEHSEIVRLLDAARCADVARVTA